MTNPICAICQQDFSESEELYETFNCCNNSFHTKCIKKLYDSKIISQIMRIAKCPLCRNYVDKDTKEVMTNEQYLIELEESIIDYDLQLLSFKEKTRKLMKNNKN